MSEQTKRERTAQRLRDLRECAQQQTDVASLWEGSYREAIAERDTALRQRDELAAALADLVWVTTVHGDVTVCDYCGREKGETETIDPSCPCAPLRWLDDAAPGAARPPEAGA